MWEGLTGQVILGTIVSRSLNVGATTPQVWVPEKIEMEKVSWPAQRFIAASLLTMDTMWTFSSSLDHYDLTPTSARTLIWTLELWA